MKNRLSLRPGLASHRLDDQLLVYDAVAEQIHLLNGTTATVLEMVEKGTATDAMVSELDQMQGAAAGSEILALALDELAKAKLIEGADHASMRVSDVNRRQMIQRLAGVGAIVLLPAIASLVPSAAYGASVCGQGCTVSNDCATLTNCTCCKVGPYDCRANAGGGTCA